MALIWMGIQKESRRNKIINTIQLVLRAINIIGKLERKLDAYIEYEATTDDTKFATLQVEIEKEEE